MNYTIHKKSSKSRARSGVISTAHGDIQTPAFVTVGTKATVKALSPADLDTTGTQFVFANTYHLVTSPGVDIVDAHGGVHAMSGIEKPIITDSGGFQVFSLAFNQKDTPLLQEDGEDLGKNREPHLVKITDDGVRFNSHFDGKEFFFSPEFSILAQQKIGADCIVAFDECIYAGATRKYTERATERTHAWADRSLTQHKKGYKDRIQSIYGVIQGGGYEDLRKESAQYIASRDFDGICLGGISVGEDNELIRQQIGWMMDEIHEDTRPRHLLGMSTVDDVLEGVKQGIDTFDCVLPTRDARTGKLYVFHPKKPLEESIEIIQVMKGSYSSVLELIQPDILDGVTFAYLHHLMKQRELLGYRLATMNNLYVIEQFFARMRSAIQESTL